MNKNYNDIINMPHHVSKKRQQMSIEARSAQFAPFAALTGYNEAVKETARLTEKKLELDDGQKEMLNNKLLYILENINLKFKVTFTYFVADKKKNGGKYLAKTGIVRKVDMIEQYVQFIDKTKIDMENIISIESELFKDIETI